MSTLHDPFENATPSQRTEAKARHIRQAKIAANARPDCPISLPIAPKILTEPVFSMGDWVERQKKIPIPPIPKTSWFSVEKDLGPVEPRKPAIEAIQRAVAQHYGVSRMDMLSERRTKNIVGPRQVAMYLAKTLTFRSLPEIGRRFGNRDHTTCLHAVKKIATLMKSNLDLAGDIAAIKSALGEA